MRFATILACAATTVSLTAADQLFFEPFDYTNGPLTTVSGGLWNYYAGLGGILTLNVANGRAFVNQPDTTSGGDDYSRSLTTSFNPLTDNTSTLYAGMVLNFSTAPSALGSYFAHFKNSGNTSEFYSRLGANQEGSAPGFFRLAVANENWSSATSVEFPLDLRLNTDYLVVLKLDLASDQSTLWVNPVNEASQSVAATDPFSYSVAVDSFALRQGTTSTSGFPGGVRVDNLRLATSFAQAVPEPRGLLAAGVVLLLGWMRFRRCC